MLDKILNRYYSYNVALKGKSIFPAFQRAVVWCKTAGQVYAAIPEQCMEQLEAK